MLCGTAEGRCLSLEVLMGRSFPAPGGPPGWSISPYKSSGPWKEIWVGSQPQLRDPELADPEGYSSLNRL